MNLVQRLVRASLASACSAALSPWISSSSAVALEIKSSARTFTAQKNKFARDMQESCHTPSLVLSKVGRHLTVGNDPGGKMSSLVLVRLAKMMITQSNGILYGEDRKEGRSDGKYARNVLLGVKSEKDAEDSLEIVKHVSDTLAKSVVSRSERKEDAANNDVNVEGIKAAGVLARLLFSPGSEQVSSAEDVFSSLGESFHHVEEGSMADHHLSGLKWAYDCLSFASGGESGDDGDGPFKPPERIASSYRSLNLPFLIRPGFLSTSARASLLMELTVPNIRSQVNFRTEEIKTTATKKVVKERRQTAWEGDSHVPGFAYSGKVMETEAFSPVVQYVRDELGSRTGKSYDCCLLNLYPDGDSGMRYHIDPDQGDLWGYETAVVSVGAARRFAFRETTKIEPGSDDAKRKKRKEQPQPHNFVVMDGDVVEMFGDCQVRFQHTVKTAEGKHEMAPRCSMVFKQCLLQS